MKKILAILGGLVLIFAFVSSVDAAVLSIGNDDEPRPVVDTYHNFTIIDTNNPATANGEIDTFKYYASNTNPFKFVVVDGSGVVKWISSLITPASAGKYTYSEVVPVNTGWNVGLYFQSTGTVPFAYDGAADPAYYEPNNAGEPTVDETLSYAGSSDRYYSFVATGKTYPYGEIIEPTVDEHVTGLTDLVALYKDGDAINDDAVNWAVRYETCTANTNTKFGNVDGHSNTYSWDGMNFSAQIDTSTVIPGHYCFVFNPTDDGPVDVRETRWFYIDSSDADNDGVMDDVDKCLSTTEDEPSEQLGVNRWIWNGNEWYTRLPKTTGGATAKAPYDTYGCSCKQILDSMAESTGKDFGGHYKFGCSKSILEDWNRGNYYIGPTFIETVIVPATSAIPVSSIATLETGKDYFLKAYGTATACWQTGCHITFDPEYSTSDAVITPWSTWTDGVAAPYAIYGVNLLDLKVDGAFVGWGTYSSDHSYQIPYPGTGNTLSLLIYDLPGSYFNNGGSLSVDIIEDKWVNLW